MAVSTGVNDLTWALCAVKTGQTAKFRSAAEGCDGLAGRVPHLAPYLACAWDSAAVFFKCHSNESRKGKSRFTGNSSQMQREAFPLNSVFWLCCCRMTHGVFLLINLFIICLIIFYNSKT